ncbi:uncharacterized protein [Henckelia pumila]|uniref:uncharacterized protein n=1 Tax=Henckelia pumila TaxID=405737 RepID=UPI003C6DCADC
MDFHRTSKRSVRSYVWDALRALAANCDKYFKRESINEKFQLKVLTLCLCFAFDKGNSESAARVLTFVVNSKSRDIASMERFILPKVFTERISLEKSLETLKNKVRGNRVPATLILFPFVLKGKAYHPICSSTLGSVSVACTAQKSEKGKTRLKIADDLNLKDLVQLAADYLAPRYHQLMNSGEIDALDADLVEKVRIASEHLIPEAMNDQSSSSSSSERSRYKGTIQKPR